MKYRCLYLYCYSWSHVLVFKYLVACLTRDVVNRKLTLLRLHVYCKTRRRRISHERWVNEWYWLFCDRVHDISVIFLTAQICTGRLNKKFGLQSDHTKYIWNNMCPSSSRHISLLIWSRIYTVFALSREETVGVSVQFHIQVKRWCFVNKQPRVRE